MRLVIALIALSGPAFAQEEAVCPSGPDHSVRKETLLNQLRRARNQMDAMQITSQLWAIWTDAPDSLAQELLDRGMAEMRASDYAASRATLTDLVTYCPDYAEGWNQRAFAAYLSGDNTSALADLDRAVSLDPVHVPALSGMALTLMNLGRDAEAQVVLRDAVELNPWLGERVLLTIPLGTEL
jgi:Tfp pilus assembly protein PilF